MTRSTIIVEDNAALIAVVRKEIDLYGPLCDLNHLDVSNVRSMERVFKDSILNGDISK